MAPIFLLSDDLLDSSRIAAEARAHGRTLRTFRSAADMEQAPDLPALVLIDLANPGLAIAALVGNLRARTADARLLAFGPHVHAAALKAARDAGCDLVLPRSKFFEDLEKLVGDHPEHSIFRHSKKGDAYDE